MTCFGLKKHYLGTTKHGLAKLKSIASIDRKNIQAWKKGLKMNFGDCLRMDIALRCLFSDSTMHCHKYNEDRAEIGCNTQQMNEWMHDNGLDKYAKATNAHGLNDLKLVTKMSFVHINEWIRLTNMPWGVEVTLKTAYLLLLVS